MKAKKLLLSLLSVICLGISAFTVTSCNNAKATEGLEFTLSANGDNYIVSVGTAKSEKNIVIPSKYKGKTVTSIGEYAFSYCDSLTSITIPDSVTNIGEYAFFCCESLTSITIPNSVTSISEGAFQGCGSLTSITIPNGVTSICLGAFQGCDSLKSITIPNSVTSIENCAFWQCSSLKTVYYTGTRYQWKQINMDKYTGGNNDLVNATIRYNYQG